MVFHWPMCASYGCPPPSNSGSNIHDIFLCLKTKPKNSLWFGGMRISFVSGMMGITTSFSNLVHLPPKQKTKVSEIWLHLTQRCYQQHLPGREIRKVPKIDSNKWMPVYHLPCLPFVDRDTPRFLLCRELFKHWISRVPMRRNLLPRLVFNRLFSCYNSVRNVPAFTKLLYFTSPKISSVFLLPQRRLIKVEKESPMTAISPITIFFFFGQWEDNSWPL